MIRHLRDTGPPIKQPTAAPLSFSTPNNSPCHLLHGSNLTGFYYLVFQETSQGHMAGQWPSMQLWVYTLTLCPPSASHTFMAIWDRSVNAVWARHLRADKDTCLHTVVIVWWMYTIYLLLGCVDTRWAGSGEAAKVIMDTRPFLLRGTKMLCNITQAFVVLWLRVVHISGLATVPSERHLTNVWCSCTQLRWTWLMWHLKYCCLVCVF